MSVGSSAISEVVTLTELASMAFMVAIVRDERPAQPAGC